MITPQWLNTKGGPTTYVKNLKCNLESKGHSVFILTCEGGTMVSAFSNVPIVRDLQILRLLGKINADVVHIHGRIHYIPGAILYKILLNKKTKIVFTFHTQPVFKNYLEPSKKIKVSHKGMKGVLGSFLLRFCDEIVSVSDSLVRNINKYCGMQISKYTVIQAGADRVAVDIEVVDSFMKDNSLLNASPIISSIGVFSWDWKVFGHKITIEAIGILKNNYPNIKLLIAGDGVYRDFLVKSAEEYGVSNNVIFCGNMDNPYIILELADVYVHMALNESLGLVIIEAMMAKKLIVAADAGGIPEIIQNNKTGILIEPTVSILANKLSEILQDKAQCCILAENAYKYASENLNWMKISEQYLSLYKGF